MSLIILSVESFHSVFIAQNVAQQERCAPYFPGLGQPSGLRTLIRVRGDQLKTIHDACLKCI